MFVEMQLTAAQFDQIKDLLPRQRGHVRLDNLQVLNAILYVAANGCKWRSLPACYGKWDTVYRRMARWSQAGVLDRVFSELQHKRLMRVRIESVSLDSTIVKVHPDGTGALKKTALKASDAAGADGVQKFIWLPQMHATSSPGV